MLAHGMQIQRYDNMLMLISGAAAEDGTHIDMHSGEMLDQLQHPDGVTRPQPDLH